MVRDVVGSVLLNALVLLDISSYLALRFSVNKIALSDDTDQVKISLYEVDVEWILTKWKKKNDALSSHGKSRLSLP